MPLDTILAVLFGLVVFAAAALGDFVEAYYTRAVADLDERRAGLTSVAMYAVSLLGFFAVIKMSVWYIVPEAIGVGVGAWIAVRRQRRARDAKLASPPALRVVA